MDAAHLNSPSRTLQSDGALLDIAVLQMAKIRQVDPEGVPEELRNEVERLRRIPRSYWERSMARRDEELLRRVRNREMHGLAFGPRGLIHALHAGGSTHCGQLVDRATWRIVDVLWLRHLDLRACPYCLRCFPDGVPQSE